MNRVVVALGSNIDPDHYMPQAVDRLAEEWPLISKSCCIVTKPLGIMAQADFLNGVVLLDTALDQTDFKKRLKELEILIGRQKRVEKWGPREIDLDLLVWNGQVVDHDFFDRDFLRQAVEEVLPGFKAERG